MTDTRDAAWPTRADLHREHLQLLADHRETMTRLRDTRADLAGLQARVLEMDDEIGRARAELAGFRQHVGANLASLNEIVTELTAAVAKDPEFTGMVAGLLRALTFNLGGYEFRGEARPGDWDPDAEYHRLAGETEADRPVPARRECGLDIVEDCQGGVVWLWRPNGPGQPDQVYLCDEHAKDIDLSELEDLTGFAEPDEPEIQEYDPGPEVDDQGGMSEYRYLTAPEEPEPPAPTTGKAG